MASSTPLSGASSEEAVTICLTMGLRPEELRQTLNSLGPLLARLPVLAVNDFGDAATNAVFREICPHGEIVDLGGKVGHHRAADALYQRVKTPFVMHLEDDWLFERTDFLDEALTLLRLMPQLSGVCLRQVEDMPNRAKTLQPGDRETLEGVSFWRLDRRHPRWFGYSFNPHVAPLALWKEIGGFARFAKEKDVSRALRRKGRIMVNLDPGPCRHIGETSVAHRPPSRLTLWRRAAKRRILSLFGRPAA